MFTWSPEKCVLVEREPDWESEHMALTSGPAIVWHENNHITLWASVSRRTHVLVSYGCCNKFSRFSTPLLSHSFVDLKSRIAWQGSPLRGLIKPNSRCQHPVFSSGAWDSLPSSISLLTEFSSFAAGGPMSPFPCWEKRAHLFPLTLLLSKNALIHSTSHPLGW